MITNFDKDKHLDSTLILIGEFMDEFRTSDEWNNRWFSYKSWNNKILNPKHNVCLVYEESSMVKGLIIAKAINRTDLDIRNNYVKKEFRGHGIGGLLKKNIELYARFAGYERVYSGCYESNIPSIKMQDSAGYKAYTKKGDYICFVKELSWD